ncbi:hypothetical protein [Ktedonobacter racemifer]|uniref:hypothetical protein n=1 Tax=Ktedonobacter racemifer TaxID=363277 RepID=UPI00146F47FF|nr:hypothetical protein [Ktedonobacter racemifer]
MHLRNDHISTFSSTKTWCGDDVVPPHQGPPGKAITLPIPLTLLGFSPPQATGIHPVVRRLRL